MSFIKKIFGIGDNEEKPDLDISFTPNSNNRSDEKMYQYALLFNPNDFSHIGGTEKLLEIVNDYNGTLLFDLDAIQDKSWVILDEIWERNGLSSKGIIKDSENICKYICYKLEWFYEAEYDEEMEHYNFKTENGHYVPNNDFELLCIYFKSSKQLRYEGIDEITTNTSDTESFPLISSNFAVNIFNYQNGMFKDWTWKLFKEEDEKTTEIVLLNFEIKSYYQVQLSFAKVGLITSWFKEVDDIEAMENRY